MWVVAGRGRNENSEGEGKKHNLEVFKRVLIRVDTEARYPAKWKGALGRSTCVDL